MQQNKQSVNLNREIWAKFDIISEEISTSSTIGRKMQDDMNKVKY